MLQELGLVKGLRWYPIVAKRDLFIQMVSGVINEGVSLGVFQGTRPKIAARGIMGMVNWCYTWFDPNGDLTPEEVAHTFAGIALGGLENGTWKSADDPEAEVRPVRRAAQGE